MYWQWVRYFLFRFSVISYSGTFYQKLKFGNIQLRHEVRITNTPFWYIGDEIDIFYSGQYCNKS